MKYFINDHYIDSSRLSIKGDADKEPIAPNDTPVNRALNRRVEIRLKRVDAWVYGAGYVTFFTVILQMNYI